MAVSTSILLSLLSLNLSIIPSGGGESKKAPIVNWMEYQKKRPTNEEINCWQKELNPTLWGIITGEISGIVVFDADNEEINLIFTKAGLKPHVKTRRGYHYYFHHPGHKLINQVGIIPHLDLRGDGGFVNCIGNNSNASYELLIIPKKEALYLLKQLPIEVKNALIKRQGQPQQNNIGDTGETIPQGTQDIWLFKRAMGYHAKGDTEEIIIAKLKIDVSRCPQNPGQPYTERDFIRIARSAMKYPVTKTMVVPIVRGGAVL
jgi:putative DNA primase/helicase